MIIEILSYLLSYDMIKVIRLNKRLFNPRIKDLYLKQLNKQKEFVKLAHFLFPDARPRIGDLYYRKSRCQINQYLTENLSINLEDDDFFRFFIQNLKGHLPTNSSVKMDSVYIEEILKRQEIIYDVDVWQVINHHPDLIPKLFKNRIFRGDPGTLDKILDSYLENKMVKIKLYKFLIFFNNIHHIKQVEFIHKLNRLDYSRIPPTDYRRNMLINFKLGRFTYKHE